MIHFNLRSHHKDSGFKMTRTHWPLLAKQQAIKNKWMTRLKCSDLDLSPSAICWTAGVRTELLTLTHAKQEVDNRLQMSESRWECGRKQPVRPSTDKRSSESAKPSIRYVEVTSSGGKIIAAVTCAKAVFIFFTKIKTEMQLFIQMFMFLIIVFIA